MAATDIIIEDQEFLIANGDFVQEESDQMHIEHILKTPTGVWPGVPSIGVGMDFYLNAPFIPQRINQDIRIHLTADNFKIINLEVSTAGEISLNAERLK